MVLSNSQWLANPDTGYEIDQSIRFNDDDSAYLTRTPSSEGNRRTFTFSTWVKFATLKADTILFSSWVSSGASSYQILVIDSDFRMRVADHSTNYLITTQKFRDVGSWYHIVWRSDTTDSTSGDRYQLYVNGSRVTAFDTESQPSLNFQGSVNQTQPHYLGRNGYNLSMIYSDLYQAETHFLDGTAYNASFFGETNSDTGQWIPKKYTGGNYGTNGFYLKGQDSSALGDDSSGNGNDFTSSGLAANDQVTDSPTNNFATWNPLVPLSNGTFSDGNLEFTQSGGSISQHAKSTISFTSGEKKVCEMQTVSGSSITLGICDEDFVADNNGFTGDSRGYFDTNGNKIDEDGNSSSYGASFGTSNVIRIEVDLSSNPGTIEFFKDGVSQGDAFTDIDSTKTWFFWCRCKADAVKANFGQLGFAGTPTANFTALNASNMPDPTIALPGDHFNTVLYTGNGTTGQSITGVGFQPDFTWTKIRSPNAYSHQLFDAVRGAGKNLQSNNTNAEGDLTSEFISFDSDGFTIDDVNQNVNENSSTYVSWNWKANGSGSSNEDGSINTTATSANTTAGFSISTFTGNQTSGATFGHGLGVAPKMVIVKERDPGGNNWMVGHDAMGWTKYLALDNNNLPITSDARWNDTAPSSTVVTLGNDTGINQNTATYVAYCFAEVDGFSKAGSCAANASTDGPFVYCGFRPSFVIFMPIAGSGAGKWMLDTVRSPFNVADDIVQANSNAAESSGSSYNLDFVSNGFKVRTNSDFNASGRTIAFFAFAESPFKTANAR
mgnify:CR=1 FL=1